MAQRTKTLWFATKLDADVVDAIVTNLDQFTAYAEAGRTFRSVQVWIGFQDIVTATGGTIGEHRVGLRLGAAAYTTITELDDITNSGEAISGYLGPFDFTQQFIDNFGAGTSQTVDIQVYFDQTTGTTLNMRNVCALIAVTYEYDDTTATQYATAIIPLEGSVALLPLTETELGTNQIPQLTGAGGLLENVASVVVRRQFFLIEGNDHSNANATDYTLNVRIDTGTTKTFNATEKGLASDAYKWFIHIESPAAGSAHAFKLWTTGATRFGPQAPTMFVTYEFAISGTTMFLNSILLAFDMSSPMGGTTTADASRFQRDIYVEEPATITLRQSAIRLFWIPGVQQVTQINVRVGSQAYRAYTDNINVVCGSGSLQQRIDSGGAQGAGITLARGKNTITIDAYRTDATDKAWNISGLIILNYTSGVAGAGVGAHNHTTVWPVLGWDAAIVNERTSAAVGPIIPETNWFRGGLFYWILQVDASGSGGISFTAERASGEGSGDGWQSLYSDIQVKDAEIGSVSIFGPAIEAFQRYTGDPDTDRMVLQTTRRYRYAAPANVSQGVVMLLTYHSITFTVSGTVSGYAGDGSGISVEIHRTDTDEKVGSATTAAGGGFTFPWHDNTINLYAHARQDATHVGRSDDGVAV